MGERYTYDYSFIIKATTQERPNEETPGAGAGRVLNTAFMEPGHISVDKPGVSTGVNSMSRVFTGVSFCRHSIWPYYRTRSSGLLLCLEVRRSG